MHHVRPIASPVWLILANFHALAFPFVPGYEYAGIILDIGSKAIEEGFKLQKGDRVFGAPLFRLPAALLLTEEITRLLFIWKLC